MQSIFHFAFNVTDLDKACDFYTDVLNCQQGRRGDTWVDYNFFGHQLSLHLGETFAVKKYRFGGWRCSANAAFRRHTAARGLACVSREAAESAIGFCDSSNIALCR